MGPFAQIWANENFPKNLLRSVFTVYSPLISCTISEKSNERILRRSRKSPFQKNLSQFREKLVTDRRTDRQHWIHRTFWLRRGSKKIKTDKIDNICFGQRKLYFLLWADILDIHYKTRMVHVPVKVIFKYIIYIYICYISNIQIFHPAMQWLL